MRIHIVQKGEILAHIAEKYGVHFDDLRRANPQLSSPDMLLPGMKIKIPGEVKSVRTVREQAPFKESKKEGSDREKEYKKKQVNVQQEHDIHNARSAERPRAEEIIPDEKQMTPNILSEPKRTTQSEYRATKDDAGKNVKDKQTIRMNPSFDATKEKAKVVKSESDRYMSNQHSYDAQMYEIPYGHYNEQVKHPPYVAPVPLPYNRCCCCHRKIEYPYYSPPIRPWHQHFYY